jgi:small subunit ribosomal protein S8
MTDSIANLIINIKNGLLVKKDSVSVDGSNILTGIAKILKQEGFIEDFKITDQKNNKKKLIIKLKYFDRNSVITDIKQVSKPGLKMYSESKNMPYVKNGYGVGILSTNKGVISDKFARQNNIGGELLLKV